MLETSEDIKSTIDLVLAKYPKAFVHDDGSKVYIKLEEYEEVTCQYGGKHTISKAPWNSTTIGYGGSAEVAWRDAANKLKSI